MISIYNVIMIYFSIGALLYALCILFGPRTIESVKRNSWPGALIALVLSILLWPVGIVLALASPGGEGDA